MSIFLHSADFASPGFLDTNGLLPSPRSATPTLPSSALEDLEATITP